MRTHVSYQFARARLSWRYSHVKRGILADVHLPEHGWVRFGYAIPVGFYYEQTPSGGQIKSALHDGLVKY